MTNKPSSGEDKRQWLTPEFSGVFSQSSSRQIDQRKLERLTISAIEEHRRRLAQTETLAKQINSPEIKNINELRQAYDRALLAHDTHHMVVHMLIKMLGYIPESEQQQSCS